MILIYLCFVIIEDNMQLKDFTGGSVVHILFLEGEKNDAFMNQFTSWTGRLIHKNKGFCHVELCIPNGHGSYMSSSIYQGILCTRY